MNHNKKTYLLIILDGWGYREETQFNAIASAKTPNWDAIWRDYPQGLIDASGLAVGLPQGQMGNSEVGHLHMGAGRRVYQDLTRIDQAIDSGEFFNHALLNHVFEQAKAQNRAVHLMGLVSPGGVHSHERHLYALLDLAAHHQYDNVFVHAFLDGRDTSPQSAYHFIHSLTQQKQAKIASIIGRYYAMDRDNRWERVQKAYELLTEGKADYTANTAEEAVLAAYQRGETDEFVKPTRILSQGQEMPYIADGDSVICFNFRSDRVRELSRALILPNFSEFIRHRTPKLAHFVTLTQYADDILSEVVFPTPPIKNMLGDYLAQQGVHQLRLAETEKYAHVTFFFNGGVETPFTNESRILVPSPAVATYDSAPAMSAYAIADQLVDAIKSQAYDFIVCNFANPDMVGHTGNFEATVESIEVIDDCLGKIRVALELMQAEAIITADHGNAEFMFDANTQQAHTAHTTERVPFVYIGRPAKVTHSLGTLIDLAPTLLYLMDIPKPSEMQGQSLLELL